MRARSRSICSGASRGGRIWRGRGGDLLVRIGEVIDRALIGVDADAHGVARRLAEHDDLGDVLCSGDR